MFFYIFFIQFHFIGHCYIYHAQVQTEFQGLSAEIMYDMVHDSSYRRNWDDAVLEDEDICRVEGACSDIGYYASNNTIPLIVLWQISVWGVCMTVMGSSTEFSVSSTIESASELFQALAKILPKH